jgi:hypothetical protein
MEPALLKSRSESPRNTNLRVHFKHPIEEDAMGISDTCNIKQMGRIDPLIQLYANEIIAAKLIEGFAIKDDGEKCQYCHMPLMVKDNAWDGMFCGQSWFDQSQKTGVCVVCPEPHEDDDDSNASSQDMIDMPNRQYEHRIPTFPDDDASHGAEDEYSRDSHDGSVGEFKKKFDITSDMHIKKIEMNTEVDEMCAKELKSSAAAATPGCRNCPSCGMEMLDFGDDLECPFCALEVIKEELGISGKDIGSKDGSKEKKQSKKAKRGDLNVEGLYLQDLVAASSSCSTLSASVRFAGDGEAIKNQCHQKSEDLVSPAPLNKVPSDAGSTQSAINAILKRLRDDDEQDANNVNGQSDGNDGKATSETNSPHLPVNAVLKRLITGFWVENNEKTLQDSGTDKKKEECDEAPAARLKAEEVDGNYIDDVASNADVPVHEEKLTNDDLPHEKSIIQQKSFNDDLHNRVKAFAAIVFGTKEEKTEMFKSNEIDVSVDDIGEEGDSINVRSQEQKCNDMNEDEDGLESEPLESHQPTETEVRAEPHALEQEEKSTLSDDFSRVESLLFNEDMSTEEIFATLNEIEAVTKNILDLPVFSENGDYPFDNEQAISREDEETSYRDDEEFKRSTLDPPSVCSRDSRDPPYPASNTYEPIDENLLLLRKDNFSTPSVDTRDPPTTIPDKYQQRLEFSFSEAIPVAGFDGLPRDPSEHGGSLELDSFSQEDDYDRVQELQPFEGDNIRRDLHQQSNATAPNKEMAEPTATSLTVAHLRLQAGHDAANRERAEPIGTSLPTIDRSGPFYRRPLLAKHLKRAEDSGVATIQRREPMEPESTQIPSKVNQATTLRAKDLYQRPEFLSKIVNEPESSRDAMIRQRLMQLNSRFHKLTSDHSDASQSESTTLVDAQLEARYQKFTSQCSGDVSSRLDQQKLNDQAIFREQRFTFDSIDLHQATSTFGVPSFGIKGTDSGLSPSAAARHAHYKKQLCTAEKSRLHSQYSNDSGACLSTSAAQRRQHYKEVLKGQMARQGSQIVSQE